MHHHALRYLKAYFRVNEHIYSHLTRFFAEVCSTEHRG